MTRTVSRIDLLVPGFAAHDAIGAHTLEFRRLLRAQGFTSEIWGEHIDPRMAGEARPYRECPAVMDGRILVYELSTGSGMAAWLADAAKRGQEVWVDYHNITPARFFARWEPEASASMAAARVEMAELAPVVSHALADSRFNEEELIEAGYRSTATTPLLVDLDRYRQPPDPRTLDRLRRARASGGARWLFVGRVAPNKCQHDVIGAFALYRRLYDPAAQLTLVGGATSLRYLVALRQLAEELCLGDSVEFLDNVQSPDLLAHFAAADVFVCMSEHEGFCVPVLEAFALDVPVVAYRSSALPETIGDAGVVLESKDPLDVANAVADVLHDPGRRSRMVAAGQARIRDFALAATAAARMATIRSWLAADR